MSYSDDLLAVAAPKLDEIRDGLERLERRYQRVDEKDYRTFLLKFHRRLGVAMPPQEDIDDDLRMLDRLPRKVCLAAFDSVWAGWSYKRMPIPGEIIQAAKDEMNRRSNALAAIRRLIHAVEYRQWGRK